MSPIWKSFIVGTVIGPLGGLAAGIVGATVLRHISKHLLAQVFAWTGGFIITASYLEMFHEAIQRAHGWQILVVLAGVAVGAALHEGMQRITGITGPHDHAERGAKLDRSPADEGVRWGGHTATGEAAAEPRTARGGEDRTPDAGAQEQPSGVDGGPDGDHRGQLLGGGNRRVGPKQAREIALSLTLVNFIEGLPIGAAFDIGASVGALVGALMVFENFPEGLAVASNLALDKRDLPRMLLYTTAPVLTLGFGGALAAWLGGLSPILLNGFLGAGGGIMVHMVVGDILEDIHDLHGRDIPTLPFFIGVLMGTLFTALGG